MCHITTVNHHGRAGHEGSFSGGKECGGHGDLMLLSKTVQRIIRPHILRIRLWVLLRGNHLFAQAMKIPPKIRVFSFLMLMCFLMTYLAIIVYRCV